MKIRYVFESPVIPGVTSESETITVEFDTSEAPLEQILKKLPQTAFVKRWSADVLEAVTPPLEQSAEGKEAFDKASFNSCGTEYVRVLGEILAGMRKP